MVGKLLLLLFMPFLLQGQGIRGMVITNVSVVDVEARRLLPNQHVVLENGKIVSITAAKETQLPLLVKKINGKGKFLMPGLIDSHLHLGQLAEKNRLLLHHALQLLISYGVTGFRDAGFLSEVNPFIAIRDSIANRWLAGPRIYISGLPMAYSRHGAESPAGFVDTLFSKGVDGIKIKRATWPQAKAVIERAHRYNLPVYGHTYNAYNRDTFNFLGDYTREALEAGAIGVMHLVGAIPVAKERFPSRHPDEDYGENGAPEKAWRYNDKLWLFTDSVTEASYIHLFLKHHAWLEPTLGIESVQCRWKDWVESKAARYNLMGVSMDTLYRSWMMTPQTPATQDTACLNFDRMLQFVNRYFRAGGQLLAGTDNYLYGYSLLEELRWLVKAGIPPIEVLRIATLNNSTALGWQAQLGSIRVGKQASLVLLDKDPTASIENLHSIRTVFVDGQLWSRRMLKKQRRAAAAFARKLVQ